MAYKSLKNLYQEHVLGISLPPLPRQGRRVLVEEVVNISPTPWPESTAGVPFFVEDFKDNAKEGEGNGERKVAAIYHPRIQGESDEKYIARLGEFVAGQSVSYDVKTTEGNFEVKEIPNKKDVQIARHGQKAESLIATTVIGVMNYLINVYNTLEVAAQDELNTFLKSKFEEKKNIPIDPEWTLKRFCEDVKNNPKNIGKQFLHQPKLTKALRGARKGFTVMSLQELETYFEEFCLKSQASEQPAQQPVKQLGDNAEKLFKLLADLYLPKTANPEIISAKEKDLEKRAEDLDRELTAFKCELAPGECRNHNWFCAMWDRIKKTQVIQQIKDMLVGQNSLVEDLFPRDVTGLYIVTANTFEFIPRNALKQYIYITTLAGRGVKIGRLSDKQQIDNAPEEGEEDETV